MSDTSHAPISGIRQIHIPVQDLDRATEFYRDTLGLPHLFTAPPGLSFFDCGGVRLMLSAPESEDDGAASLLYYAVDDIQAAWERLRAGGARMGDTPQLVHRTDEIEIWIGQLWDSEGNRLALMSELSRESAAI